MTCINEGRSRDQVVLVHGIWMNGLEMSLLQRRLQACGFACQRFHYPSLGRTPAQNAAVLNDVLKRLQAPNVHLVAHSLGGILVLHLFDRFPEQRPGRVVLLGTPVAGSRVARRLAGVRGLRWLLGRSTRQGVLGEVPGWSGGRQLGVIAGTRPFGAGRLVGGLPGPSDGTVAVAETRLPGASAHLLLPVTHTGLLFSRRAARAICSFLHAARFENGSVHDPGGSPSET